MQQYNLYTLPIYPLPSLSSVFLSLLITRSISGAHQVTSLSFRNQVIRRLAYWRVLSLIISAASGKRWSHQDAQIFPGSPPFAMHLAFDKASIVSLLPISLPASLHPHACWSFIEFLPGNCKPMVMILKFPLLISLRLKQHDGPASGKFY